ncbi:DUF2625 domain-containing protein [Mucilaginibacter sp. 14171R-50]|uniref:DUF2625 domain-containing protein n=1 Tax=Mucilaginibacter sp. 14171R-50 TaxID=2703789 RepID=UPI00138B9CBA|nr:DUF2625 domain-containing protein [Mucilaginibacter sp. 14171R-50]QHS56693.1 DUF2625 domain-containing protein [Mucilaginibacter sp. 14171R-50]
MRPINILTADKSGQTILKQLVKAAKNPVTILPANQEKADEALYQTQVTTRSLMGAVIYFTGGILIDNGWIRILGCGSDSKMNRSLPKWNKGKTFKEFGKKPTYLLIGDDAIGGLFAINGGALGQELGKVYYLAPETLKWESLGQGYSEFLDFCLNGNLDLFYKGDKWEGWQKDVATLNGDNVFSFYPYLWSKEGKDISKSLRTIVPLQEQYDLTISTIKQLGL